MQESNILPHPNGCDALSLLSRRPNSATSPGGRGGLLATPATIYHPWGLFNDSSMKHLCALLRLVLTVLTRTRALHDNHYGMVGAIRACRLKHVQSSQVSRTRVYMLRKATGALQSPTQGSPRLTQPPLRPRVACHSNFSKNSIGSFFHGHWPTQLPHDAKGRPRRGTSAAGGTSAAPLYFVAQRRWYLHLSSPH